MTGRVLCLVIIATHPNAHSLLHYFRNMEEHVLPSRTTFYKILGRHVIYLPGGAEQDKPGYCLSQYQNIIQSYEK